VSSGGTRATMNRHAVTHRPGKALPGAGARVLGALLLAVAVLIGSAGDGWAQSAAGQGPRFPFLGPTTAPPDSDGPARDSSPLPPGRSARCRWDLRGTWDARGQQTEPSSNNYSARMQVRQYGNYLAVDQPAEGITYVGVCSGDRVELDAYSGSTFVGAQTGTVSGNGRRIEATWVLYAPDYAAGYETLTATSSPQR
jgi:hypothetical protein